MNVQLTLARRYLAGRKLRTTLTTLAVTLGVMILFGMNTMLPTMMAAFRHNVLAGAEQVDLTISSVTGGPFESSRLDTLSGIDGIEAVTGSLQRQVVLPPGLVPPVDPANAVSNVTLVGLDPATAQNVRSYAVTKGRFLAERDVNGALLPQSLANKLGLDVGARFRLPSAAGSTEFVVVGILTTRPLPGEEQVFVTLPVAQTLLNLPGQITQVEAIYAPDVDRAAVESAVRARLGEGLQLGALESGSELYAAMEMGQVAFGLFGVMALAMGAFIIFNSFRAIVAERRRDLAMLRALGAERRTILGLILTESLAQGVIGSAVGLLAGYGLALGMIAAFQPIFQQVLFLQIGTPQIEAGNVLGSLALGLGTTLFGGLLPALSAARVTPLEALRPVVAAAYERAARRRSVVGVALLALAVLGLISGNASLAGLGTLLFMAGLVLVAPVLTLPLSRAFGGLLGLMFAPEGHIAEGNLARQPNRAAITAAVAMIGLAFTVAMAGMISSIREGFMGYIDRSLGADVLVMPESLLLSGGNVGAAPELTRQIQDIPGISAVTTLRLSMGELDGQNLQVIGIDPQTYPQLSGLVFSAGDPTEAFAALDQGRALIVNGITAAQYGIQMGELLSVQTVEGAQEYRVVAIAADYLNAKLATAYLSQANLERDFHQTTDALIMADIAEGADAGAVRQSVAQLVGRYPAFRLLDWQVFRESQQAFFDRFMGLLYAVAIVFAVPVLMAMINTLAINVLERTREIGVLRAIGSTGRQVQRMIRAESLLLAAIGTGFGILAGLWLGYVLIRTMSEVAFVLNYYFPWSGILLAAAIGLIIGVLAAGIPARRATRLDIITALRYE